MGHPVKPISFQIRDLMLIHEQYLLSYVQGLGITNHISISTDVPHAIIFLNNRLSPSLTMKLISQM